MPWTRDRDTGQLIGYSGPKMTAEDYERHADLIIENWRRGYTGGEASEVFASASIARRRARELRAVTTP